MADPSSPDRGYAVLTNRIISLERRLRDLESPSGTQRNLTVARLADTVARMPLLQMTVDRSSGFGLSSGWNTVVSTTLTVPDGKARAQVIAIGTGAAVDAGASGTGGLTSCYGRVQIGGQSSGDFPPAKDHGASAVNNVMTATLTREYSVTPGQTLNFSMQMQPLNQAAFPVMPANFAQIAVLAVFDN